MKKYLVGQFVWIEKTRKKRVYIIVAFHLMKRRLKTIQEAKLWWRRFIQYGKMARTIDLNMMTTDKEIIEEYRELEIKIKILLSGIYEKKQ